jgi:hypothetical protein
MEDDKESKDFEGDPEWEPISTGINDRNVFQPIWVRRNTILSCVFDRKFIESQFRFVWYLGSIFWIIFFISKVL